MTTAVEWLYERLERMIPRTPLYNMDKEQYFKQAKEMEEKQQGYSEEDMGIIEISSIEANYIPHYQTKEGQFLATKFNVKKFKNK